MEVKVCAHKTLVPSTSHFPASCHLGDQRKIGLDKDDRDEEEEGATGVKMDLTT